MAFVLAILSLDEAVQLHELASRLLERVSANHIGLSASTWLVTLIVMLVPVLVSGLLLVRFARRLNRSTAFGIMTASAVFVCGAVLVDAMTPIVHPLIGGWIAAVALHALEEGLEMLGVVLLIHVLLVELAHHATVLPHCLGPVEGPSITGRESA